MGSPTRGLTVGLGALTLTVGFVLVLAAAASAQVSQPPQPQSDTAQATAGETIVIDVLANDTDPDGDPLTIVLATGSAEITADNKIEYTADLAIGTESFSYYVTDDPGPGDIYEATVSVDVVGPGNWNHCDIVREYDTFYYYYYECEYPNGPFTYHYRLYQWNDQNENWDPLHATDSGYPDARDTSPANAIPDDVDKIVIAMNTHLLRLEPLGINTPSKGHVRIQPGSAHVRCALGLFDDIFLPATASTDTAGNQLFRLVVCTYNEFDFARSISSSRALVDATANWFSGRSHVSEFLRSSGKGILDPSEDQRQYGAWIFFKYLQEIDTRGVAGVLDIWGANEPIKGYLVLEGALPRDDERVFAEFWTWVHDNYPAWQARPCTGGSATCANPTTTNVGPGGGVKYEIPTPEIGTLNVVVVGNIPTTEYGAKIMNLRVLSESSQGKHCSITDFPILTISPTESILVKPGCTNAVVMVSRSLKEVIRYTGPSLPLTFHANFQPAPPAPTVNAGSDRHNTTGTSYLSATVGYNGTLVSAGWRKVSGPGTATFSRPADGTSTVTLSTPGTYVLAYDVEDEYGRTASDTLTIWFDQPPVVNAGPDLVTTTGSRWINATVTDDGASPVSYAWSNYGPASVTFSNPYGVDTTVTFNTPGTARLRLTARDGKSVRYNEVLVTYDPPPVVNAGYDRTVTTRYTWPAAASASNQIGTLSLSWSKVSGPGTVTFAGCGSTCLNPKFEFSKSGNYWLRLTARDGRSAKSDLMRVTVNTPPRPYAGPNRTLWSSSTPTAWTWIYGSTSDDWVSTVTRTWSKVWGPGTVYYSPTTSTTSTRTKVKFYKFGTYKLRLRVSDGVSTRYDYVYFYVKRSVGGFKPI